MYPRPFEYFAPHTVEEAVSLLARHGEDARVLAGGMSLLPLMKLRLSAPRFLIDIKRVSGLSGIRAQDGRLVFGALTRHVEIEESSTVKARLPIMAEAAASIGDVQVRNWGTIGGALAHADPAGDWSPTLLALDGRVTCVGPRGERTLSVEELETGAYTTSLAADEIVTEVIVPLPAPSSGGAYVKFERKAGDFAVASAAVQVTLDQSGACQTVGVGLGAVGLTAIRPHAAESLLTGRQPTDGLVKEAAEAVRAATECFEDTRGTVEYKRHLIGVLFARAFDAAVRRARGEEGQEVRTGHV
jgi:carbon-monoxide dehydrogenase medium subunit